MLSEICLQSYHFCAQEVEGNIFEITFLLQKTNHILQRINLFRLKNDPFHFSIAQKWKSFSYHHNTFTFKWKVRNAFFVFKKLPPFTLIYFYPKMIPFTSRLHKNEKQLLLWPQQFHPRSGSESGRELLWNEIFCVKNTTQFTLNYFYLKMLPSTSRL